MPGKDPVSAQHPEPGLQPPLRFPGAGWRWASGHWKTCTEPPPRPVPAASRAGRDFWASSCPSQTQSSSAEDKPGPTQAKAARPARGPRPEEGAGPDPAPPPRPPPSFVNHRALYAGSLAPGCPLGPGRCPGGTWTPPRACAVPAARGHPRETQPSYLNVLLGTHSQKHRALYAQSRPGVVHTHPSTCLILLQLFFLFSLFFKEENA